MTVAELIEELKALPPTAVVSVRGEALDWTTQIAVWTTLRRPDVVRIEAAG